MESQSSKTLTQFQFNPFLVKGLGFETKKLGSETSTSNPNSGNVSAECADWLMQNRNVYESIVSGTSGFSQADQVQFMDYWNYASSTAQQNSQWGNGIENSSNGEGPKYGPNGNLIFNQETAETTYSANGMPVDVLSDDFTLNVDEKVKNIDIEKTTDTRLQPPSEVIKITVYDPTSSPDHTTYFVNPDAKITINTIGGKGVTQHETDKLKLEDGSDQISIGSFQAPESTEEGSNPPASIEGKKNAAGDYEYTAQGDDTIDFWPSELGGKEKTRVHKVWGNSNIIVPGGFHADVQVSKDAGGKVMETTVTIKDKDGNTTDVYKIQKGFTVDIQANEEYVKFGSAAEGEGIPKDFSDSVHLGETGQEGKDSTDGVPDSAQALADAMEIKVSDIPDNLIEEMKNPVGYPSSDFLNFLAEHDEKLKAAIAKWRTDSLSSGEKIIVAGQVRDRMVELLQSIYGSDKISLSNTKKGESPDPLAFMFGTQVVRIQGSLDGQPEHVRLDDAP